MSEFQQRAVALLGDLRINGHGDGPAYGGLKAEAAGVFAMLAVAEAIEGLADELRGMGTQAHPVHTTEV